MPNQTDLNRIAQIINPLLGQRAWRATLGIGSFVTLDFGSIRKDNIGKRFQRGQWHWWVKHCAWRLEDDNHVLAGSGDSRSLLREVVQQLEGQTLESVVITSPAAETTMIFEAKLSLRLFPMYIAEYESWELFTPEGMVLVMGPGSAWRYQSADAP